MSEADLLIISSELATGGKSSSPPYAEIEKHQATFIMPKYLPRGFKIKQPRNLTKPLIQEMFKHLSTRQEMEGPQNAFRFKSVKVGRTIVQGRYPPKAIDADAGAGAGAGPSQVNHSEPSAMAPGWTGRTTHMHTASRPHLPQIGRDVNHDADATANADIPNHHHYNADGIMEQGKCSEGTFVKVGLTTMVKLQDVGIAMPVPYTGPADGPPLYPIACHIYKKFIEPAHVNENNHVDNSDYQIDPALLASTPMPTPTPTPTIIRTSRKAKEKALLQIGSHDTQTGRKRRK